VIVNDNAHWVDKSDKYAFDSILQGFSPEDPNQKVSPNNANNWVIFFYIYLNN